MLRTLTPSSRAFRSAQVASPSRVVRPSVWSLSRRSLASTSARLDDGSSIPPPTARELIAAKQRQLELKYALKLKQKIDEEGVASLEELKEKKKPVPEKMSADTPSMFTTSDSPDNASPSSSPSSPAREPRRYSSSSPIAPLSTILNLDALLSSPHPFATISTLWQTLHSAKAISHPNRFLSATIPTSTYATMHALARQHPQFVLPLPREGGGTEFFFLQWAFYEHDQATVIFTSLEEYKLKQGYARPFLTLTHWTDLAEEVPTCAVGEGEVGGGAVLMRGEITSTTPPKMAVKGKDGEEVSPPLDQKERYLIGMADAQLLLLGLQRFYNLEGSGEAGDREQRRTVLEGFTKGDWQEKEWEGLKGLAVGSLSGLV